MTRRTGRDRGRAQAVAIRCGVVLCAVMGVVTLHSVTGAAAEPKPRRIVSLDVCTDQLLIGLVERDRIAAVTHLAADASVSAMAEEARGLPVTHGGAEDVLAREPDLVLAGPYGVSGTVALLARLRRNVSVVPLPRDFAGVRAAVAHVARAVGEEARGEAMIAEFDLRIERVASRTAGRPRTPRALVYQVGGAVAARDTLVDAALHAAGFANAADDYALARNGQAGLESILASPPDVLVLGSSATAYRSIVADNLRHPALTALRARLPSLEVPWRLWLCGTPRIAEVVERLAEAAR